MPPHVAQVHRIRIFVVPDTALMGDPPPLGNKMFPSPRHLSLAQDHVRKHAPELVDDVRAIIVIGDKPATFLNGTLVPHNAAIAEAVIRVWTESDTIEWMSEQAFAIVSTQKADHPIWDRPGTPNDPFHTSPPFDAAPGADGRYRAQSSTTRKEANGQQYKVTISIANRLVDPDYVCGSPPPP
jgi:hypothetical protein